MSMQFAHFSRKPRRLDGQKAIIYLLSIACGALLFLAGILVSNSISDATKREVVEPVIETPPGTIALIVPNSNIEKGQRINPAQLRKVPWPRDAVPPGAVQSFVEAESLYAQIDLPDGIPILKQNVAMTAPEAGIVEKLPQGFRAIAINVTETSSVESRATAGAHVDVLLTYRSARDGQITTRLVSQNAVVLSLGGNPQRVDEDDPLRSTANSRASTVTLAVPFGDSLRIQTALALGSLSLILRSRDDVTSPKDTDFSGDDFEERSKKPRVALRPARPESHVKFLGPDGIEHEYRLTEGGWETELSPAE